MRAIDVTGATVEAYKAEHNARQGFVEPGVFAEIVKHLPDTVADAAQFAYITGWRREAVSLQWQDVDLAHRHVRLRAEHSKNEDPGLIVLKDELLELMEHRHAVRTLCPWVFHRGGRRLMDFRRSWEKACAVAGAPGLLFHDLCRSAIRNMDKAGVSQVVAMRVAGKKTDSVYRRYWIVDEQDIERALDQTQAMLRQTRATSENVVSMPAR